jgi:hypothetical protein
VVAIGLPVLLIAALLTVVGVALTKPTLPANLQQAASSPPVSGPAALPPAPPREARSFYVSPDGQPASEGTNEHPLDLASALSAKSPVAPGDTLWLRKGVYEGTFVSEIHGRPDLPIYVKQYPGERAILDGAGALQTTLEIAGGDVWFWGFEVTNSSTHRVFETPSQGETRRATGVSVSAPRVRLINLIVHDAFTGVSLTEKAASTELYGCVIYNNGIREPQGGVGHGLLLLTGSLQATDVVSFNNQGRGINAGPQSGRADAFVFDGLVSFDNGQSSITDPGFRLENMFLEASPGELQLINSHLYHPLATVGQNVSLTAGTGARGTLTMSRNAFVGGSVALSLSQWRNARVTENLFYIQGSSNPNVDQRVATVKQPDGSSAYQWNANRYVDQTAQGYPFIFNRALNSYGGANLSFPEWQKASQFDAQAQYQRERPSGAQVFVRANRYEPSHALAIVYNWDAKPSVDVPLTALGMKPGDRVEVVDIQRLFDQPLVAQPYSGQPIAVPMIPPPSGIASGGLFNRDRRTLPEFGVFVIRKIAAAKVTTAP